MLKISVSISSFLFVLIALCGCKEEHDIYKRPDWLAGKVFDQILEVPELSISARCLELTGLSNSINKSGSYTVFCPSNDAWEEYLNSHPEYDSVGDIPADKLSRIMRYHILQNPWSKQQLRSMDVFGWIDTLDITNDKPRGFKRETLLIDDNRKYGISYTGVGSARKIILVDTLSSNYHRMVYTDSRKFAPVFYSEYFDIYDLNSADFSFYFSREFETTELYFAGAKIISEELFAENGFIYMLDKVVEPLETAYEKMEDSEGKQYSEFFGLLNLFPNMEFNQQRTYEQPGAEDGLVVDSLFNLSFPNLVFDFASERTVARKGEIGLPQNVTIRYHHGMLAPTNTALQQFLDKFLRIPNGWQSIENAPQHIKLAIARSHMSQTSIYPTDFKSGFLNGEEDIVVIDESAIVDKEFCSNSTFIGLNEAIVPRAFSSVTGPVYLKQGYKKFMYAIEASGLLPALKRLNQSYMLFLESDLNSDTDSSFFYNNGRFTALKLTGGGLFESYNLTTNDLRNMILNHVGVRAPGGIARKEFIPNLAGNYLIFNNETGEVSGTDRTTAGFLGIEERQNFPTKIEFDTDNGSTYEIDNWFSFTTSDIYTIISLRFPSFHSLLVQAGLAREKEYRYTFISANRYYTIFAPSDEALAEMDFSTYTTEELRNFLLLHFVRGNIIFTDGFSNSGYYTTERIDEKSTSYNTINTNIYIETGIDEITIKGRSSEDHVQISESERANLMAGIRTGISEQEAIPSMYINAVIHEIDKFLEFENLDTQK